MGPRLYISDRLPCNADSAHLRAMQTFKSKEDSQTIKRNIGELTTIEEDRFIWK